MNEHLNPVTASLITLQNHRSLVTVDCFGGAITAFRLKDSEVNPLSFAFSKEQMPANNQAGAPYHGHFLCLGRWGEPSQGEKEAGLPDHGQFANIPWEVESPVDKGRVKMAATSALEGLLVERVLTLDRSAPVYVVDELVGNINPLGRLFNMVQHPTLAAPFLDQETIIDSNAARGFDQHCYQDIPGNLLNWPVGKDNRQQPIDLRRAAVPYNAVFSFVVASESEYGWITAFSPTHRLLTGYLWKRTDYPWIHCWQHFSGSEIRYRGIEFGTAGIHQPFREILNVSTILFGEKTFAYIDAGERISKKYLSFIYDTGPGFAGVNNIQLVNGQVEITGQLGEIFNINLSK